MLLGGAWGDPVDGALFIFLVNSADGKCFYLNFPVRILLLYFSNCSIGIRSRRQETAS